MLHWICKRWRIWLSRRRSNAAVREIRRDMERDE